MRERWPRDCHRWRSNSVSGGPCIVPLIVADDFSKAVRASLSSDVFETRFGQIEVWACPQVGGRVQNLVGVLENTTSLRFIHRNHAINRVNRFCVKHRHLESLKPVYDSSYTQYLDERDVERICDEFKHRCEHCGRVADTWTTSTVDPDTWQPRVIGRDENHDCVYERFCSRECSKAWSTAWSRQYTKEQRKKTKEIKWLRIGESKMREVRQLLRARPVQQRSQQTESKQATTSQT